MNIIHKILTKLYIYSRKNRYLNFLYSLRSKIIQSIILSKIVPEPLFSDQILNSKETNEFKLHIIYRHVSKRLENKARHIKNGRPRNFSYRECFSSMLRGIPTGAQVVLTIIFDGSEDDYLATGFEEIILAHEDRLKINVYKKEMGSQRFSFIEANFLALNDAESDYFYFCENDYMHHERWYDSLSGILSRIHLPIISLYRHIDYSTDEKFACRSRYRGTLPNVLKGWNAARSATGSFVIKRNILNKYKYIILYFGKDHEIFPLLSIFGCWVIYPENSLTLHGALSEVTEERWNKLNAR